MKNFLFALLISSTASWANPVLNPDCQSQVTDSLDLLKKIIQTHEKNPRDFHETSDRLQKALQKAAPEYTPPKLLSNEELFRTLKMSRIIDKARMQGQLSGLLFTHYTQNSIVSRLFQHHSHLQNRDESEIILKRISFRSSEKHAALVIKEFAELARISRASRIIITNDLTFHFEFRNPEDASRFVSYTKEWLNENSVDPQKIPFALDIGSGLYVGALEDVRLYQDLIQPLQIAQMHCKDEACKVRSILDFSGYDFKQGVLKGTNVDDIRKLLAKEWPPFAASPKYVARLGDLSGIPEKARQRILHMAATQEDLSTYPKSNFYDYPGFPKSEPLKSITADIIKILRDPLEFGIFLSDLMRETALLIQAQGNDYAKQQLEKGIFTRAYIYKILAKWNEQEGLPPFHKVKKVFQIDAEFRMALKKGLFVDAAFSDDVDFHGIDVHIVEMMYLIHRLTPKYGSGAVRQFLNYVTENDVNIKLWGPLLDDGNKYEGNYHSPEVFTLLYSPYLELY